MTLFKCTIPGRCAVKKNQQKVFQVGSTKRVVYSKQYLKWAQLAMTEMKFVLKWNEPIAVPIEARYKFYFANHASEADTSNLIEGVSDCLKDVGVIADDKLIHIIHAQKFFGYTPHTEVELRAIEAEEIEHGI